MLDPITKYSTLILSRQKMPETLRDAIRIAFSGKRGPVHLSYSKDIMEETIEDTLLPPKRYHVDSNYFDRKLVIDTAEKLVQAKRPAMLLGSGVTLMRELQECLPGGAIVFVDVGNHTCWALHYLQVKKPSITFALGLAAMGYATPATIGGELAD